MSEANKQIVKDLWACLSNGNFERMAELYDEDVQFHGTRGEERRGRTAAIDFARAYRVAFPDMQANIEQLVAEGDYVVSRINPTGTNTGVLLGMPARGRTVDVKWVMSMVRIHDGKIVEEWEVFDMADFMRQLGMA